MGSAGPTYTILINGTNPDLESAQFVQTAVDQSIRKFLSIFLSNTKKMLKILF